MKEMATESSEAKKLLIIRIMQILEYYSDANHPLKQEDIIKLLEDDYVSSPTERLSGELCLLTRKIKLQILSTSFVCRLRIKRTSVLHLRRKRFTEMFKRK